MPRLILTLMTAHVHIIMAVSPTENIILWPNGAPNETQTWPHEQRTPVHTYFSLMCLVFDIPCASVLLLHVSSFALHVLSI